MARSISSSAVVICIVLFCGVCSIDAAENTSVAYGQAQYTESMDGVKTVYYTPNLCSKDVASSLPASDELHLALDLGAEVSVISFQVALANQLDMQQQEQVVVRVGDVKPDEGPSANPLCRVATVNSSSLMATYTCEQPLNGTYITVTKNDGGPMNICGFSATLSTSSPINGPFLSADSLQAVLQNNQTTTSEEDTEVLATKSFAEAPSSDSDSSSSTSDPIIFGYNSVSPSSDTASPSDASSPQPDVTQSAIIISDAPGASQVVEAPADSEDVPVQEARSLIAEEDFLVQVPVPAPSPALSPSTLVILPVSEPAQVVTALIQEIPAEVIVPSLAPVPAPAPALSPSDLVTLPSQVVAALIQEVPTDVAVPSIAPSPVPSPMLAPASDALVLPPVVVLAAEPASDDESLTGVPIIPAAMTPASSPQILVIPVTADTPAPEPSLAVEPPISFSRANLIADPNPTPVQQQSTSQSGQGQNQKGSGLSSGDKAGIAVGVIAGVALLAGLAYFVVQRRR